MKKIIILLIVFFTLPLAYGMQQFSNHIFEESFDSTANLTCIGDSQIQLQNGKLLLNSTNAAARCYYNASAIPMPNMSTFAGNLTYRFSMNISTLAGGGVTAMMFGTKNLSNIASGSPAADADIKWQIVNRDPASGGNWSIEDAASGGGASGWRFEQTQIGTGYYNFSITMLQNNSVIFYIDNNQTGQLDNLTQNGCISGAAVNCSNLTTIIFGNNGAFQVNASWDFFYVWNGTISQEFIPPISGVIVHNLSTQIYYNQSNINFSVNISTTSNYGLTHSNLSSNISSDYYDILFSGTPFNGYASAMISFGGVNGVYNLTVKSYDATGLVQQNSTIVVINQSVGRINFSVWDEYTDTLITQNASIYIIGNSYITNASTTNGFLFFTDLTPDDYRITYSSLGYTQRDHYVKIVNGTNQSIQLYLLSTANSTSIDYTIQNENSKVLSNATIKLLRHFISGNIYKVVAMTKTDETGVGRVNFEFYNGFYYQVVEYQGVTILITDPSRIVETSKTLTGQVGENIFRSREAINKFASELTFTNSTQTVRWVYNDPSGITRQACLIVDRLNIQNTYEYCRSCSTSSSATLTCIINTTLKGDYNAFGHVETNTAASPYVTSMLSIKGALASNTARVWGDFGPYLTAYGVMMLALVAIQVLWLSITFTIVGLIVAQTTGILGMTYGSLAVIVVLGAILIFMTKDY